MFTIRFETQNLQAVDYCVYQCDHYRVFRSDNLTSSVTLFGKPTGLPDDGFTIEVGHDAPFIVAFVTNEAGKTVDKIYNPPTDEIVTKTERATHRR